MWSTYDSVVHLLTQLHVVLAVAEGVIRCQDANLLACNGSGILFTKSLAKSFLHRMGMVKRWTSSKAKVDVQHFENLKEGFLLNIKNIRVKDEIPLPLWSTGIKQELAMYLLAPEQWN